MLAADVDQMSSFLHEVRAGGRAASTLSVFLALAAFVERDTGLLACSQRQLARTAGVDISDTNRALDRLVEIGVLIREGKGKYRVHPSVMWRGQLSGREKAEETAPRLTLYEGGKGD
jgi:DNA-binding IclR family transcriptional regulator